MATSPSSRSLAHLRKQGYMAGVVERFIHHIKIRKDLFDCIDIIAISPDEVLAVQTTSRANVSSRIKKIRELPHYLLLLHCPMRLIVHGWDKGANGRWRLQEIEMDIQTETIKGQLTELI